MRATLADITSWERSLLGPALEMPIPLDSESPVPELLGARPLKDLKARPLGKRPGRPIAATRTGPPTVATPGRLRAKPAGSAFWWAVSLAAAWALRSASSRCSRRASLASSAATSSKGTAGSSP